MKPIGVVVNPKANRGKGAESGREVFAQLAQHGVEAIDLSGEDAQSATKNAKAAIGAGQISALIAVGGDGTAQLGVNLCVEGKLPLGLVPAGSGNDQARQLGISRTSVREAVSLILEKLDSPSSVDVMRVRTNSREFWSLGSISAGFDALCAQRANGLKWPKGSNSYVAAMLLELPKFAPIHYRIVADGKEREFKAMLCGVANVKNFGGGMKISPGSEITDGELEVFILHEVSRPRLLRIFPTVYSGGHTKFPEVEIFKAKEISIANDGFPMTCDGELIGPAPFSVEVHPGALGVLA